MWMSRASRIATRRVYSRATAFSQSRSVAHLAPHPSLLNYNPSKLLPFLTAETELEDFPDEMTSVDLSTTEYYKVLKKRAAASAQLAKKNLAVLVDSWRDCFPVLVRLADGNPALEDLYKKTYYEDLTSSEKSAVQQLVESKSDELQKATDQLDKKVSELGDLTLKYMWPQEIQEVQAMSPDDAQEYMWEVFGRDLNAEAAEAKLSPGEYVATLEISDSITVNRTLNDYQLKLDFINRFDGIIDTSSYNQRMSDHLQTAEVKEALEGLKTAQTKDEAEAFAAQVLLVPTELIREGMMDVYRNVGPGYIPSTVRDQIRVDYSNFEEQGAQYDFIGYDKRLFRNPKDRYIGMKAAVAFWGTLTLTLFLLSKPMDWKFEKEHGLQRVGHRSTNLFKERV